MKPLKKKGLTKVEIQPDQNDGSNIHIFHPDTEREYSLKDLLTIKNEQGNRSMKVTEWLSEDPVSFDITRRKSNIKINKEVFDLLVSKLKAHHPDYFKDALGLRARIEFKGYDRPIPASIPYSAQPVEFYKWWCTNQDNVNMTIEERIKLFDKVYNEKPSVLKREHKREINK